MKAPSEEREVDTSIKHSYAIDIDAWSIFTYSLLINPILIQHIRVLFLTTDQQIMQLYPLKR